MDTEEVDNANSFPNTTDCFHHNEGKQPLLLSSTSTNNTFTKTSQPTFCSQTKPPRPTKCSKSRREKGTSFSFLPSFFLRKIKQKEKKVEEMHRSCNSTSFTL
ncbi:hypothetical protein ATANTOWER_018269 [Ataeniobius toweri]|uniref:Uncharacterized protein n=1 Tax=Ataeniobius toweri TaxID=208326 RepID=A0ABU7BW67_9TELE|nr:hypothetical protein [Ataeniobius toweri]